MLGLLLACGVDGISPLIAGVIVIITTRELSLAPFTPRFGLIALLALVLASTGLLLHPSGLGNVFGGLAAWFARMTDAGDLSLGRTLMGVWVYELPLMVGAIGTLALLVSLRRIDHAELHWLSWLGIGFILLFLTRGRSAADVVPLVIGMAGFAARIVDWLFTHLQRFDAGRLKAPTPP